ncbi:L domain-like protein [Rhizopus microsporus var. microsporus]|nr:L domain-like protein [Rhizopus microsporus var. microsporus]
MNLSSDDLEHELQKTKFPSESTEFDASRNYLATISTSLNRFNNLTSLNLSSNHISTIDSELYLPQLTTLLLSDNQIEFIPDYMPSCFPSLVVLHLDGNRISLLPRTIGQWHLMQELKLGSELFGGNAIEYLPESITQMKKIIELNCSYNQITSLPSLQGINQLQHLNLSFNRLERAPDIDSLGLKSINLSNNRIVSLHQEFVRFILSSPNMEVINLSHNRICVLPSDLLEQSKVQVIIKANPLIQPSNPQEVSGSNTHRNGWFRSVRQLLQRALPVSDHPQAAVREEEEERSINNMDDYTSTLLPHSRLPTNNNNSHLVLTGTVIDDSNQELEEGGEEEEAGSTTSEQDEIPPYLIHSLREIALRDTIKTNFSATSLLPPHIAFAIENKTRICPICERPYIYEWVSSIQSRQYHGYNSTLRSIKFCSTRCWKTYREKIRIRAEQLQNAESQRQRALEFLRRDPEPLQPESFSWVVAAVTAAREQDEQIEAMTNAI